MEHIPSNLRMAAAKMSNYNKNAFRLESVSADILPADSPLRVSVADAIEAIRSSFQVFLVYLTEVYFPQCREDPSCSALPNGAAMYESCLRYSIDENVSMRHVHNTFARIYCTAGFIRQPLLAPRRFTTSA